MNVPCHIGYLRGDGIYLIDESLAGLNMRGNKVYFDDGERGCLLLPVMSGN